LDLVREGETGYVFPCGDVDALAAILQVAARDRESVRRMGESARARMADWSQSGYARALVEAVTKTQTRYSSLGGPFPNADGVSYAGAQDGEGDLRTGSESTIEVRSCR